MKVGLFVTCLVDTFFPGVGEAMVRILNHHGVEIGFPEGQTCCGQPAWNSGYADEARQVARPLLDAFVDYDYVISPSGSCAGMIHHNFGAMFKDDPVLARKAAELDKKMFEFSQFLVDVMGITDLGALFPHRVTYHPSCHAHRLMGVKDEPLQLLQSVRGLELLPLDHGTDCCGFGGTFSVKMPKISAAMVTEKATHVEETGADVLTGIDMGCLMNIGGRLRRAGKPVRVMHVAELLYEGMIAGGVAR